jgi:hypothetical protein
LRFLFWSEFYFSEIFPQHIGMNQVVFFQGFGVERAACGERDKTKRDGGEDAFHRLEDLDLDWFWEQEIGLNLRVG